MSKTCSICFDSKKKREFLTLSCCHIACIDCVSQWITLKIADKHHTIDSKTTCLMVKCKKEIPLREVHQKLPALSQQKMDEALLQVYFSKQQDIRRCPNSSCNYAGIINIQKPCTAPLQCDFCGTEWREKEHYKTLENLQDWFRNGSQAKAQPLSEYWIKQKSKQCPSCSIPIEKNGGCDHMTCKFCSYEFCWICLGKHSAHNQLILTYHRNFIPFMKTLLVLSALFLTLSSIFGIMPTLNLFVSVLTWLICWTLYIIKIVLVWFVNFIYLLGEELLKSHDESSLEFLVRLIFEVLEALASA